MKKFTIMALVLASVLAAQAVSFACGVQSGKCKTNFVPGNKNSK